MEQENKKSCNYCLIGYAGYVVNGLKTDTTGGIGSFKRIILTHELAMFDNETGTCSAKSKNLSN
jgi:hypothetical protein